MPLVIRNFKKTGPGRSRDCRLLITFAALPVLVVLLGLLSAAQAAGDSAAGKTIYQNTCSACHGYDGRGLPPSTVGLEMALPDFTSCASFN